MITAGQLQPQVPSTPYGPIQEVHIMAAKEVLGNCPPTPAENAPRMVFMEKAGTLGGRVAEKSSRRRRRTSAQAKLRPDIALVLSETEELELELLASTALSPQEEVICMDSWNKVLGWRPLFMDLIYKRWLTQNTDLLVLVDAKLQMFPDLLFALLDTQFRSIRPSTEKVQREAYRAFTDDHDVGCRTLAEFTRYFAVRGFRPRHWVSLRPIVLWAFTRTPYLEEYELQNIHLGSNSAIYKHFTRAILMPMAKEVDELNKAAPASLTKSLLSLWQEKSSNLDPRVVGGFFYDHLFTRVPAAMQYFETTDMDMLSAHLADAVGLILVGRGDPRKTHEALWGLGETHRQLEIPSSAYPLLLDSLLATLQHFLGDSCTEAHINTFTELYARVSAIMSAPAEHSEFLYREAEDYLGKIAGELKWDPEVLQKRLHLVRSEIRNTGTYSHTTEELTYGAQLAWRNASKCIGRVHWSNLVVRDKRAVTSPDAMFAEVLEHMKMATAGINIISVMTVFAPKSHLELKGPRFWNDQIVRYACYTLDDGSVIGDRANKDFTQRCIQLGWTPPEPRTPFDVLPVIIQADPQGAPRLYELPPECAIQVDITHPTCKAFDALGLRWAAVPAISSFRMTIGGIDYCCCPFNGWFMGTEIARDLVEADRYDLVAPISKALDLDQSSEQTLWRDKLWVELNLAVLHSFAKAKTSLVDHYTASRQFLTHDLREKKAGRECPAQWSWVVPPLGGSQCPVWHHEMRDFEVHPQYHYQSPTYVDISMDDVKHFEQAGQEASAKSNLLITFGTESGTAETLAHQAAKSLKAMDPVVLAMDEIGDTVTNYKMLLVVISTFGNGEPPRNAVPFIEWLENCQSQPLENMSFAVCGLGSSIYAKFCAAGVEMNKLLKKAGAQPLMPLAKCDEIKGQMDTFSEWLQVLARSLGADDVAGELAKAKQVEELRWLSEACTPKTKLGTTVKLVGNDELLPNPSQESRSTRYISLDIAGTGLTYQTGDHLAVFPRNSPGEVERLGQLLCNGQTFDLDTAFEVVESTEGSSGEKVEQVFPTPSTLRHVLSQELDITFREPFAPLLTYLHGLAADAGEKEELGDWLKTLDQGSEIKVLDLKTWILDNLLYISDLLEKFPSAKAQPLQLIKLLPKQKQRFYSIASAAEKYPSEVRLAVGVLQIKTDAGCTRPGVCSNFLASLKVGSEVQAFVRQSTFRSPSEPQTPMILVGPGTGIAPMIAFLEQREQIASSDRGITSLFFGCHNDNDFIFKDEIDAWKNSGVLTDAGIAFSRPSESGAKGIHVQDIISDKEAGRLWDLLFKKHASLYICGDATMADDVTATLKELARDLGGLERLETDDYFTDLQNTGRFQLDVWGPTVNYKESLKKLRKARYSRAKSWSAAVKHAKFKSLKAKLAKAPVKAQHNDLPKSSWL